MSEAPRFTASTSSAFDQPHHRLRVLVAAGLQALVVDLAGLDLLQDAVDRQLVAVELVDVVLELRFAGELRS